MPLDSLPPAAAIADAAQLQPRGPTRLGHGLVARRELAPGAPLLRLATDPVPFAHATTSPMMCTDSLEIRLVAGKGRGVFARRGFAAGSVIELCPVIDMPQEQWEQLDQTGLEPYCYEWGEQLERPAIALGYGSLYNHAFAPSAIYRRDLAQQAIAFIALRDIAAGEEITVNYNGDPFDQKEVWFAPVE